MPSIARLSLCVLHLVYSFLSFLRFLAKPVFQKTPRDLSAKRRRIPGHLAIIFALPDKSCTHSVTASILDSVERAVTWCRTAGIERLTLYDHHGILINFSRKIRDRVVVPRDASADSSDSDIEYPLTPPISRPLSPEYSIIPEEFRAVTINLLEHSVPKFAKHKFVLTRRRREEKEANDCLHQRPLTIHLVDRRSSKLAIAAAARSLARTHGINGVKTKPRCEQGFHLSVDVLESMLEGEQGLLPPDLLIVHHPLVGYQEFLELHGFPPWQIRLTEIFHCRFPHTLRGWLDWLSGSQSAIILDELQFRAALDEYADAEMRLGK